MVVPTTLCTTRPTVVLFTADWCGHCIKSKTQFTILQEDTSVHVVHYESGNNDTPQYVAKAKEFQIVGYPSIFIYTNNIWYKYNKQNIADMIQQYAMNPSDLPIINFNPKPTTIQLGDYFKLPFDICSICPTVLLTRNMKKTSLDHDISKHVHFIKASIPIGTDNIYIYYPDTDIWYIISTHVTCLDIQKRTSMKVILLPMLRLTKITPTQSTLISCECAQCIANAAM